MREALKTEQKLPFCIYKKSLHLQIYLPLYQEEKDNFKSLEILMSGEGSDLNPYNNVPLV